MPRLFGKDIAAIVARKLGPKLLDATLVKVIPGARSVGNLAGGLNANTSEHAAKGIVAEYEDKLEGGTLTARRARKVLLLGGTIAGGAVPAAGDRVTIEGSTYAIEGVERDPAAATYTLSVRA